MKKNIPDGSLGQQSHYAGKIEPIEAIEAWGLDFHLGTALKYIVRAGKKDGETRESDLTKALWYATRRQVHIVRYNPFEGDKVTIADAQRAWALSLNLQIAVSSIFLMARHPMAGLRVENERLIAALQDELKLIREEKTSIRQMHIDLLRDKK